MLFNKLFSLMAAVVPLAAAVDLDGYEYVVVGSGAGGGPLAARLAIAGHKTLLIEAGDDQGKNQNYTVPAFNAKSSEDEHMAWNFFVRHYEDDAKQARDYKTVYDLPDGGEYIGLDPLRAPSLRDLCTPYIAEMTGDDSWSADNMRTYFERMEDKKYLSLLPLAGDGHGYKGWHTISWAPLIMSMLLGGAFAIGNLTKSVFDMTTLLAGDANANTESRDQDPGYYQIPISTRDNTRVGSREFVLDTRDAVNSDGSKKYPLDVRMNCHVTKVTFDDASPLSRSAKKGVPGSAKASREVVVAGGVYNSPQILKLSGVGPAEELKKFNIPVVADLPGVGTNLQDHYEISVQARTDDQWVAFDGCTWHGDEKDSCIDKYENPGLLGDQGVYASNGLAATMYKKSSTAPNNDWDTFVFGGPVNFRGYFPGYSINATDEHDWWTWAILKSHPRNNAGGVTLRSADPLDMPDIMFHYYSEANGEYKKDLQAMVEAVGLARDAFARQPLKTTEVMPGPDVQSQEDLEQWIQDITWGHHASSTCPIGTDSDPMAVLDSAFRVRKVQGLRVVDASVYPRIPGTFTAVSTYMVAEKAADVMLAELK
ncbi:GMC oxidoreductase [Apiospora rasikravindrae]|uniref:GMC oxidoreductase n=1 Tax=Apiospora rasikravindrae TaxID=990691 RepID=A0ABR1SZN7_9PEZI